MTKHSHQLFVGFAAEDRHTIAEPIVYHLQNYGVNLWYDRHSLLMGDNRRIKNLEEGAGESAYACIIISKYTSVSKCAMEEFAIIEKRFRKSEVTVFPVLYELFPEDIPSELLWIKEIIFKEVSRSSGTREICNHIACRISADLLISHPYKCIADVLATPYILPPTVHAILRSYKEVDCANLNGRISLLYAAYLSILNLNLISNNPASNMAIHVFERLFSETRLNLSVDYRELRLLENAICILINQYLDIHTDTESNI